MGNVIDFENSMLENYSGPLFLVTRDMCQNTTWIRKLQQRTHPEAHKSRFSQKPGSCFHFTDAGCLLESDFSCPSERCCIWKQPYTGQPQLPTVPSNKHFFHFALTRSKDKKNIRLLLFQQSQEHRCKELTARDLREVSFDPCFSAWKYGIF